MLGINMDDVYGVVNACRTQLISFGVVLVIAVLAMILCMKLEKAKKYLIRTQAGAVIVLALVITVNAVCLGPMSNLISLTMGTGSISQEAAAYAEQLVEDIMDEGIVLTKNEDSLLPLTEQKKINVFGWSSTNPCYGGTGSGALNDNYEKVDLLQGLHNAGFETNEELSQFYTEYRSERPIMDMYGENPGLDWSIPEPPVSTYSDSLIQNAKDFSDVAVVVFTRVGGEGPDIPVDMNSEAVDCTDNSTEYDDFPEGAHYLELCQSEKDLLDMVCGNFEDVVIVYNGANTLEMGFVNEYSQIKSVLLCPGPGQTGFNSLGAVLSGEVNPSGRTADTFAADLTATPTWNNFGNFGYTNMDEFEVDLWGNPATPTFLNYTEGIYIGYRYYETAAAEGVIDYEKEVVYPFGYGLSYTSFTQEMGEMTVSDGKISFDVIVTNTGDTAGKDVVEVYYEPPYTNGGAEKASANLVAFAKTNLLQPGESQTLSIEFLEEDLAFYDKDEAKAYVLEKGDYVISINKDSHNRIAQDTYTAAETVIYGADNKRSTDQIAAVNAFEDSECDLGYLSRADGFANYEEVTAAPADFEMSQEHKAKFLNNTNYRPEDYNNSEDEMPVTGADNGIRLAEMRGLDYEDGKWEELLDQLTVSEMNEMIALGGFQTAAAESIEKVQTTDCDGTGSINNNFTGVGSVGFPSPIVLSQSWNVELAKAFGESIGQMANDMNVSGWYAPSMNTHRTAFCGRNFEYYSEDGVLAGKIAANAVAGANEYGVYAYIKHFALNEQETNRQQQLCEWVSEQAVREIYLKPFEYCVKEGGATAVMSAYNYIGGVYAGAHSGLLQTVLRDEWGFQGMVLTDYFAGLGFQDSDQEIRNGGDICLATYDTGSNYLHDTSSATSVIAMRRAAKNILYTVVNSHAYSEEALSSAGAVAPWKMALIAVDVLLAALLAVFELAVVRKGYQKRKVG